MKYIGSENHLKNIEKARLIAVEKNIEIKNGRIEKYKNNPNKCNFCDKPLNYCKKNNKFCSSSCAAKYNNSGRVLSDKTKNKIRKALVKDKIINPTDKTNKIERKCSVCNNIFEPERIKSGRLSRTKFCSINCCEKGKMRNENSNIKLKCSICGIEFTVKTISNNRLSRSKYCSIECQNKDASNRMKLKANEGSLKGWSSRNITSYPEKFFINVLNNNNIKFQHNHPVNKRNLGLDDSCNFFLDFYIEDKKIDLEIDGNQHKYRREHDEKRDKLLKENGFIVYRIQWKNINSDNGKKYMKEEINKFLEYYGNS